MPRAVKARNPFNRRKTIDLPDASAAPVEEMAVAEPEVVQEPKARSGRRRIVRPVPVVHAPASEEPAAAEPKVRRKEIIEWKKVEPAPLVFTEAPIATERPAPLEAAEVEETPAAPRKRGRPSKIDRYLDLVGVLPDEDLATMAGVAVSTVRAWRKVKGLPRTGEGQSSAPWVPEKPEVPASKEEVPKERKARKTRMDAFLDRIGVLPDSEVATLAGVTPAYVGIWRRTHGIPAPSRKRIEETPIESIKPEPVREEAVVEVWKAEPPGQAAPSPTLVTTRAYLVVASDESEFIVLADGFAQAAQIAVRRLARWRPEVQVVGLEYAADFLPE